MVGCKVSRYTGIVAGHQDANRIKSRVDRVTHRWAQFKLTIACGSEHILNAVRKLFDIQQPGGTGTTFEAMGFAEKLIQQLLPLRMSRVALQFQQDLASRLTMLGLLGAKSGEHLGHNVSICEHRKPSCDYRLRIADC